MSRCGIFIRWLIVLIWCLRCESSVYDNIVQQADNDLLEEERILASRQSAGVDTLVPDFTDLAPSMLGSHSTPLLSPSTIRNSKLINRINLLARTSRLQWNFPAIMATNSAQKNNLSCPFPAKICSTTPRRYRSFDGGCDNLRHPTWGAAFTPFVRQLPPAYESETVAGESVRIRLPRQTGVDGYPLPSARLISNVVHPPSEAPLGTDTTTLYTNFGQSLSHDIADTPMESGAGGAKLGCCNQNLPTSRCFNIDIPENDDFFRPFNRTCMSFTRSAETTDIGCSSGVREQINIVSAFVDVTQIYGHDKDHALLLRDEHGLLKASEPNHLPLQAHPNLKALQHGINYFMAGDEKNGEFPGLIGITTLFQREHNRIAEKMYKLKNNPFRAPVFEGDSEKTFLHTRKIVIALVQHIVYNEYLPVTLGPDYMAKYKLNPLKQVYYQGHDPNRNPAITNVVATAAMRFGHSMVRNTFSVIGRHYINKEAELRLKKIYWRDNFYLLFENGFQRGVLVDDSEKCDRHMSVDLKDHMFETKPGNGLDLAALNIQRGRDHGLPSYNAYRRSVDLSAATEWTTDPVTGFADMTMEVVNKLKAVYRSPEDVDVWSGGVSETPVKGGQVGPLFAELLGGQFQRLREGDFYWYENMANGFTLDQLREIRKYSLAKMMCNNFPVRQIQPKAFLLHTVPGNERVPCERLPDLNLYAWGL